MEKQTISRLLIANIILLVFVITISQVHEYQHYNDFKEMNCTNISYQFIKTTAYCPDIIKATRMSEYRDKQVITLWFT